MKNNKIKAVIFDMDGLIVDTEIVESKSLEILIKNYGKKPKHLPNGLLHVVGASGDQTFIDFLNKHNVKEDLDDIKKKKRAIFEELLIEKLTPLPGLLSLINLLKNNKIKIALASNRNEKHVNMVLDNLEIKKFFEVIVGPNEHRKPKPHPDIYLDTAKELGVKPEECIVLEDTDIGIEAAKTANMKAIAVPNQYTKDHDFSKADLITNSLKNVTITMLNTL